MEDDLKNIIDAAILAPSGENCQPWRFEVAIDVISIYNLPQRDESLYNWDQKASLIAHGAVLENIKIKALALGLKPVIKLFPNTSQADLIATIKFERLAQKELSPLEKSLHLRCTNRKAYKKQTLNKQDHAQLLSLCKPLESTKVNFIERKNDIETIAEIAALNEKILFENSAMHDFFFNHISWSAAEDREKSVGFFIDTLELPAPARFMLKLAKNWKILEKLNKIGFSKMIAKANAKTYSSCGGFVGIIQQNNSNENYIFSGNLLERFWLAATHLHINIQPLTGTLFLIRAVQSDLKISLSAEHHKLLSQAKDSIEKIFQTKIENLAMILRLGYGPEPSAKSSRLQPEITYV